jgi:hypothetical protein
MKKGEYYVNKKYQIVENKTDYAACIKKAVNFLFT